MTSAFLLEKLWRPEIVGNKGRQTKLSQINWFVLLNRTVLPGELRCFLFQGILQKPNMLLCRSLPFLQQSINQKINQRSIQSINQSPNKPTNQLINISLNKSTNQSISWLTSQSLRNVCTLHRQGSAWWDLTQFRKK